jgi:hypothetical protein
MTDIVTLDGRIPAMAPAAISKVRALEAVLSNAPQRVIDTHHVLHGGQYTRTVMIPANTAVTGALIKVATTLIVAGDCTVYIGDETVHLVGYNILAASAGRKQAFVAHSDTYLTMTFATSAKTIEQAEDEFTDEADLLLSRSDVGQNTITITGE